MKKILAVAAMLALGGCGTTGDHLGDPGPPPKQTIIEKKVPVPVSCQVSVTRPQIDIDSADPNVPLEDQNATLRQTIAQQATYITDLVAAVIGCGGKVIQSSSK